METLLQDIRYGCRSLIKQPSFTIVAVLTLALGIGANTAIFRVVNAVLLRPLPYRDSNQIMSIWQTDARGGVARDAVSPANFVDLRDRARLFEAIAAAEPFSHALTGQEEPESIRSWLVSAGFFQILDINPFLGRTFTPEEYQLGNHRVIVMGYGLWQRRFGANRDLVGQQLMLLGVFAILALALAAVGIYGLVSFSVSQRTHEFGVRIALGARPGDISRMVVREGMILALLGSVIGLGGAFVLTRFLSTLLFNTSPTDLVTFGGITLLLVIVALVACFMPARRATRVDPMIALGSE